MKHTVIIAVVMLLLAALGFAGTMAAYPHRIEVPVSSLASETPTVLVGDFAMPWPFRINKRALDAFAVVLPDGSALPRQDRRARLNDGPGFFVDRPTIHFRLDDTTLTVPAAAVSVTLPVRLRAEAYIVPLALAAALLAAAWLGPGARACLTPPGRRRLPAVLVSICLALAGLAGLFFATGAVLWLALAALLVAPPVAAATLLQAAAQRAGRISRAREPLLVAATTLGAVLACCVVFELYLGWPRSGAGGPAPEPAASENWFQLPPDVVARAHARERVLSMPAEWRRTEMDAPGAWSAYSWHGAPHIRDRMGFRRHTGPFPDKDPDTFRIMVVGDSLTYGVGIAEEWTYARLLQRGLEEDYNVEILNLGRPGFESEDILEVVRTFLPRLQPDLVVYAVCLNDFQPSERLHGDDAALAPPAILPRFFLDRTALAPLADDALNAFLLQVDIRQDYFDRILIGGRRYQDRFASDVAEMNRFVRAHGLPPIVGIVFQQLPGGDPRGWDLVEIAERALADAGFDLVSVMDWRIRFNDRVFPLSRWDSHPNELAHSLVAEKLDRRLRDSGLLAAHRLAD